MDRETKTYFYEDGAVRTIESTHLGKLDGETCLYWQSGKLKRRCHFKDGIRHGSDEMWNEEGVLADSGTYEMGRAVGTHRRYGTDGSLLEEIIYLDTNRYNYKHWDSSGILRVEASWLDNDTYLEKVWDRFKHIWIEKRGVWDGKKLVYAE